MGHVSTPRRHLRAQVRVVTWRLIADYSPALPAGSVILCVARCQEQLLRSGVGEGLDVAVEAAARRRLGEMVPPQAMA